MKIEITDGPLYLHTMSCQICLEDYSKKLVQITCQHCPTNACRGCLQRYLLQSYEDPHCVSCKRGWSTEFMAANFPLSFRNDALRKHRRKILFEREKSILPTMQVFVEYRRNITESEDKMNAIRKTFGDPFARPKTQEALEIHNKSLSVRWMKLRDERVRIQSRLSSVRCQILDIIKGALSTAKTQLTLEKPEGFTEEEALERRSKILLTSELGKFREERDLLKENLERMNVPWNLLSAEYKPQREALNIATTKYWENRRLYEGTTTTERREFIMKCADETCRGFLSSSYKCGTCSKWTCSQCLVIIGENKDDSHTCDPNTVETAKTIKSETRPCPKCGTRIFKVDGCFAKDTPILTWTGKIKLSQDISVGDELVGDDGTKRIVEETCIGEDELYEVSQTRGLSYTVNSKHKLALKPYNHITTRNEPAMSVVKWFNGHSFSTKQFSEQKEAEFFLKQLDLPDVIEITVDDYMKLSQASKDLLYGYRGSEIHWPHKDVRLDPYLMGLWLGDGINDGMNFACNSTADPEIIQTLLTWCDINGCELVHDDAYRFRVRRAGLTQGRDAINHGATSATCKGCAKKKCNLCDLPNSLLERTDSLQKKNPLKNVLDTYDLIKNKHIPSDYIVNDRETRLQLLAGFIDTDGCLGNNGKRVQISQANHTMANQLALVARSLGFVVSIDIMKKEQVSFMGGEPKDYPPHVRISISGKNLSEIPTRIQRKKCYDSTPNKDWFKTSITVKALGRGSYYGWSINGNKRFMMEDMTCLRNCDQMWCVMEGCNTAFSWDTGHVVTGAIHNPHYYEWLRRTGGGAPAREVGDIPCGGLPGIHQIFLALRSHYIPSEIKHIILETHRNIRELVDIRLRDYPARQEALANKDTDVLYLMKMISEAEWQRQLELSEAKFNRKKEIGQILQTLATAGSDLMNHIVNQAEIMEHDIYATWISTSAIEQLEQLRIFGNESLKNLGKRDRMAIPQFEELWKWKGIRALYKPVKKSTEVIT